jgi:hypothetical protein
MATRSDQQNGGRYQKGGTSEVVNGGIRWWERRIYKKSPTDIKYTIPRRYQHRPDLLAYDLYGKASMQWFILQYNTIIDIMDEFVEGAEIYLPTTARLYGEILSSSK